KADSPNFRRVAAKRMQTAIPTQPPEVTPFETAEVFLVFPGPLSFQELPRPCEVARLPSLLGRVQVRSIEQAASRFRLLFVASTLCQRDVLLLFRILPFPGNSGEAHQEGQYQRCRQTRYRGIALTPAPQLFDLPHRPRLNRFPGQKPPEILGKRAGTGVA